MVVKNREFGVSSISRQVEMGPEYVQKASESEADFLIPKMS